MPAKKIGREVQHYRKKKGWTQEKLAEESGLEVISIAFIESGQREPRIKTLRKLADALGVLVKDLIPF